MTSRQLWTGLLVAGLVAGLVTISTASPRPRMRVACRAAGEGAELSDSARDLKQVLAKHDRVDLMEEPERAELVVEISSRGIETRTRTEWRQVGKIQMQVPKVETCKVVRANIVSGDRQTAVTGEACPGLLGWGVAAGWLAGHLTGYLDEHEEGLLLARSETPSLDAEYRTLTKDLRKTLGMKKGKGVVVTAVTAGGVADQAGLQVRDLALGVDGTKIKDSVDLTRALAAHAAGDTLSLLVERDGDKRTVSLRLAARIAATAPSPTATGVAGDSAHASEPPAPADASAAAASPD